VGNLPDCVIAEDGAAPAALCMLFNVSPSRSTTFHLPPPPAEAGVSTSTPP